MTKFMLCFLKVFQHSHEPQTKTKQKQAPITLKNISGERTIARLRGGGKENGCKKPWGMNNAA